MLKKHFLFFILFFSSLSDLYSEVSFNWNVGVIAEKEFSITLPQDGSEPSGPYQYNSYEEARAEASIIPWSNTSDTEEVSFYIPYPQWVRITYGADGCYSAYEVDWPTGYVNPRDGIYQTLTPGWYKIKAYVYRDWWKCWFDRKL